MAAMFHLAAIMCAAVVVPNDVVPVADANAAFIRNEGQFDADVQFLLRRPGLNVWVTRTGATYDHYVTDENGGRLGQAVRVSVEGATAGARAVGGELQPGHENYYVGDQSRWVTGVRRYREATIENLMPGVSMRMYVSDGAPRYDLICQPGVDPNTVSLRYEGAENLRVAPDGTLQYETQLGTVSENSLLVYQKIGGVTKALPSRFVVDGNHRVRFFIQGRDPSQPVVIDPRVISRCTYLGGGAADSGQDLAVSPTGKVYVAGTTSSDIDSFPVSAGAYQPTFGGGGRDWFVSCLSADLSSVLYRTYIGTASDESSPMMELTQGGNIIFGGVTAGAGLPLATDAFKTAPSANDAFICRVSGELGTVTGGTYFGGTTSDTLWDLKLMPSGSFAICGSAVNGLPTKGSQAKTARTGPSDAYLAVLAGDFKSLNMSTYFGGLGVDVARGLAVGANGAIFIAGLTASTDLVTRYGFTTDAQSFDRTLGGTIDGFVARIEGKSGRVEGVTFIGSDSTDSEEAETLTVTPSNNVMVGARITGSVATSATAYQRDFNGVADAYLGLFSAGLTKLIYGTFLGGSYAENVESIIQTSSGSVIAVGWTESDKGATIKFPTAGGGVFSNSFGRNLYVARLSSKLETLISSLTVGGTDADEARGVALQGRYDNVYITGEAGKDLPTSSNAAIPSFAGGASDAFVMIAAQTSDPVRLEFSTSSVRRGSFVWGKVVLNAPAPPAGLPVRVTTADPGLRASPADFVIPAGQEQISFRLNCSATVPLGPKTVTATGSGSTVSATIEVTP
jgi:hypothetical protein